MSKREKNTILIQSKLRLSNIRYKIEERVISHSTHVTLSGQSIADTYLTVQRGPLRKEHIRQERLKYSYPVHLE